MSRKILLPLAAPLILVFFIFAKGVSKPPPTAVALAEAPVLGRAFHYLEKNYVDRKALEPKKLLLDALRELERAISPFVAGVEEKKIALRFGDARAELPLPTPVTLDDLPQLVRKALGFLQTNYQGRLDAKDREYLATTGMVDGLDPHSNFLTPKVYKEFRIGTRGNFGGLGIVIGIREGNLTVIAPLEETPAWKAGIRAKDRIVQIGEEATINMSLTEAVEKLRGPIGSSVSIAIERTGIAEPLHFTLKRALIEIRSVAGRLLEGKRVGLVKIKNFQEDTVGHFDKLIRSFLQENPKLEGLILDLRNNPGGLLDQAIRLGDRFLASGVIVKTVSPHQEEAEEARPGDAEESLPLVVLVNEGSASASEIIAGAFKFNDRALVIGRRTFGKGTVQTVYDLKDGSALKLTIAKYLTAGDHEVQGAGIEPDLELLPIQVSEEVVDLYPPKEEKGGGLPIPYLERQKEEEEDLSTATIPLEEDFPVQLARRLLEFTEGNKDRPALLRQATLLSEQVNSDERQKIAEALEKIGIDWSVGEKRGRPRPVVQVSLQDESGSPLTSLIPGQSGQLVVEAQNQGNAPLYQFAVVTKSEDPLFNQLEFPFGRLNPKETRKWKTPLKLSDLAAPRSEPVEFVPYEAYGRGFPPLKRDLVVAEVPLPRFAYLYEIKDGGVAKSKGNRNGQVEPGETILLKLGIRNEGKGQSPGPVVNLRNLGGPEVFIESGRAELPPLDPEGIAEAELLFRVPRSTGAQKVSLELEIQDKKRGNELTDRLEFSLAGTESTPTAGAWQAPPALELPPLKLISGDTDYRIKGVAADDRRVRHLFIFVGEDKEVYLSPEGEKVRIFPFEARLPLKDGINIITVGAQDDRELTTRRQWLVWKRK